MSLAPTTRAGAIDAHCRSCVVDPGSAGTWREQVACCVGAGCALFAFRPMPRQCIVGGLHVPAEVAKVRDRIERANRGPAEGRA